MCIRDRNNLAPSTPPSNQLQAFACHRCKALNVPSAVHCTNCTAPLDLAATYAVAQEERDTNTMVMHLAKVLVEQGLLDQAVSTIHEANLGPILQRLAQQERRPRIPERSIT